jgi:uncharacterized protein YjbI with pentapeptide repeats
MTSQRVTPIVYRDGATFAATLFTALLLIGITAAPGSAQLRDSTARTEAASAPSGGVADTTRARLERDKLYLEVEKLRNENTNSERSLGTWRGWQNLIFANLTGLFAVFAGLYGFLRYRRERRDELRKREDARFEEVAKSLGSEHEQQRISAAAMLPTFLGPGYERFYIQVFNLAVANLRTDKLINESPLTHALVDVFRDAYPRARALLKAEKSDGKSPPTERTLNASGVRLDGAHLAGADLKFAYLRGASLNGACLDGAYLDGAILEESNLRYAVLKDADMRGVNLKGTDLTGANLEKVTMGQLQGFELFTRLDRALLRDARLVNLTLEHGTAIATRFDGADLSFSKFIDVDFGLGISDDKKGNPEAAAKLNGARFLRVTGFTEGQIVRCVEKGATVEPAFVAPTVARQPAGVTANAQ